MLHEALTAINAISFCTGAPSASIVLNGQGWELFEGYHALLNVQMRFTQSPSRQAVVPVSLHKTLAAFYRPPFVAVYAHAASAPRLLHADRLLAPMIQDRGGTGAPRCSPSRKQGDRHSACGQIGVTGLGANEGGQSVYEVPLLGMWAEEVC